MSRTRPTLPAYPSAITGDLPKRRRRDRHNAPSAKQVLAYMELLDALGLDVPAARDCWARYLDLREQRADELAAEATATDQLASQLAAGDVTAKQAATALAKAGDPAAAARTRKQLAAALHEGRKRTLADAMNALCEWGDAEGFEALRPIVADCLERPRDPDAQDRWRWVHELAAAALPSPEGSRSWTAPLAEQRWADPAAPYWWRLDNSRHHRAIREWHEGEVHRVELTPDDPPTLDLPTIAAHADEWQPGLYEPAEAIAAVRRVIAAEHERAEELAARAR